MFYKTHHYYYFFEQCLKEICKEKIILDLGTPFPYSKELKNYQGKFRTYFTMNYRTKNRVDVKPDVDGNIQYLPFKAEIVDAIICKDVLEHIPDPHKAVKEICRVLKKNGKIYCSLPFFYPYHPAGCDKKDYYRFTRDTIRYLFRDFRHLEIVPAGGLLFIVKQLLPVFIGRFIFSKPFMPMINFLDKVFRTKNLTYIYMVYGIK